VINEVLDNLASGLLGYSEVLGYVSSGGITFADPCKRETMCRANVIKATASEAFLYPVHKLTGEAQHCHGRLPTGGCCHDDHLDIV
jgi:hypothetical protein